MTGLFFLITVTIVGLVPFKQLLAWIYTQSRTINKDLDQKKNHIRFERKPLIVAANMVIQVAKGIIPILAVEWLYLPEIYILITSAVLVILHAYNPLLKFRPQSLMPLLLTGLYAACFPEFFWVFPILGILMLFLLNSYETALVVSVLIMFGIIAMQATATILVPTNFVLFVVVILRNSGAILRFVDGRPLTVLDVFNKR